MRGCWWKGKRSARIYPPHKLSLSLLEPRRWDEPALIAMATVAYERFTGVSTRKIGQGTPPNTTRENIGSGGQEVR